MEEIRKNKIKQIRRSKYAIKVQPLKVLKKSTFADNSAKQTSAFAINKSTKEDTVRNDEDSFDNFEDEMELAEHKDEELPLIAMKNALKRGSVGIGLPIPQSENSNFLSINRSSLKPVTPGNLPVIFINNPSIVPASGRTPENESEQILLPIPNTNRNKLVKKGTMIMSDDEPPKENLKFEKKRMLARLRKMNSYKNIYKSPFDKDSIKVESETKPKSRLKVPAKREVKAAAPVNEKKDIITATKMLFEAVRSMKVHEVFFIISKNVLGRKINKQLSKSKI